MEALGPGHRQITELDNDLIETLDLEAVNGIANSSIQPQVTLQ
jgi:hypothetical protein